MSGAAIAAGLDNIPHKNNATDNAAHQGHAR